MFFESGCGIFRQFREYRRRMGGGGESEDGTPSGPAGGRPHAQIRPDQSGSTQSAAQTGQIGLSNSLQLANWADPVICPPKSAGSRPDLPSSEPLPSTELEFPIQTVGIQPVGFRNSSSVDRRAEMTARNDRPANPESIRYRRRPPNRNDQPASPERSARQPARPATVEP